MGEWVRVAMYRRKRTCKEDRREGKGEKSKRVVIGEDGVCVWQGQCAVGVLVKKIFGMKRDERGKKKAIKQKVDND